MKEYAFTQRGDQVRAILAGCRTQARVVLPRRGGVRIPGDRLWVKEAWRPTRDTTFMAPEVLRDLRGELVNYRADWAITNDAFIAPRFMPRWACRLVLEIVAVRTEPLQAITEADAVQEGLPQNFDSRPNGAWDSGFDWWTPDGYYADPKSIDERETVPVRSGGRTPVNVPTARQAFCLWWDHINGKRAPWASNPNVAVLTFRVLP